MWLHFFPCICLADLFPSHKKPWVHCLKCPKFTQGRDRLHSHHFNGKWCFLRRQRVSYGILPISGSMVKKNLQCDFHATCAALPADWVWSGCTWPTPSVGLSMALLPQRLSVVSVHARCCTGAWAQVHECGGGSRSILNVGEIKERLRRGCCSEKVWPQGINLWETGLCHCSEWLALFSG